MKMKIIVIKIIKSNREEKVNRSCQKSEVGVRAKDKGIISVNNQTN